MPTMFEEFAKVGMAQALECAGTQIRWVFEDGSERPITALVSEENAVPREVGGQRTMVKTRGMTLTEDATQKLFALVKPNNRHRFWVPEPGLGTWVQYAVHETVSRAGGGTTIIGERIERRETVRPNHFAKG